ncbi:unnamed protein product [Nyctereutes procyonoides]|uniref:(raccoon dog) hypothetical protein n=1 Tax=Nyctereutes procyonoides TaxID=34880 RepID=A0A811ZZU6_NYCPR|nr:unnamed protein product [Nyctereutes procyonoides]
MTNTNKSKGALPGRPSAATPRGRQAGGVPPPRAPRAASSSPAAAAAAAGARSPRGPCPGAAFPRPAHAAGSPRPPPRPPGRPGPLVPEPARAATCRGRRASQRPAAAILHFKPAALFRESTLTCEPYTRNRSAGRHTASAARRAPRSAEGRGVGGRGEARAPAADRGGEGGKQPAEAGPSRAHAVPARPHPAPRRALGSRTPRLPWGPTPASTLRIGALGGRAPPRPSVNRSPAPCPRWPRPLRLQSSNQVKNMSIKTSVKGRGETRPRRNTKRDPFKGMD